MVLLALLSTVHVKLQYYSALLVLGALNITEVIGLSLFCVEHHVNAAFFKIAAYFKAQLAGKFNHTCVFW